MQANIFMDDKALLEWVKKIIKGVLFQNSLMLYHIRWQTDGKGRTMQIYLTGDGKNVSIDDCAKVNRYIVKAMEANGIERTFSIEVGTAGTDRELFTMEHFKESLKKTVFIRTYQKFSESYKFEGMLKEAKDDHIIIENGKDSQTIPIRAIKSARIINSRLQL